MKKLMKFTAFALAVVMLVPLFASCMSAPPKDSMLKQITLTALLSDKEGVDCTSGFAFAGDGISKGVIEAGLTVSPKFDYRLGKTADGITLTPTEPLEQNTVYTFKLAGSSQEISRTWAFQTKRPFKIDKVSPENGGERVSCRAGIEIVSSHLNSEIAPFVTIYPPVAVEREVRGYKTIIRPKNSFKPNTTYSVKIDKKAKSPFGDELGEDYVFSFTTDGGDRDDTRRVRLYNDYAETFLPDENPVVEIYLANGKHEQELAEIKTELTVYKITEEQYITAIKTENDREFAGSGDPAAPSCDVSGITPLYTEQADIPLIKSYNARAAVPLPEALPKGLYAVSLKVSDKDGKYIGTTQKLLQITDVSFYSQSVNGETLIWLNSSETGKPVVGANIEYTAYDEDGTIRTRDYENGSKTDTYGRYIFNPNEGANETAALIKVTLGGKTVYCGIIDLAPQAEKPLEELYYAAVHTDRTIYLPTDTVSFWGTVFPRSNKAEMPKEVKAYLIGQNNSSYYYQQPEVIAELTLPLDADGVFAGSIPFEKLRYSDYRLKIMPAEAELDIENAFYDKDAYVIENVWVTDYEKPLYKTSAEAVKPFFTADEPINLNFTANFYDGTPATELEVSLNAYYGGSDAQQNIKTSGDGVAEAVYNVDAGYLNERKSWRPTRIYNYFELAGIENSYQYGKTGMASFLPRDIMLNLQYSDKGETGALTLTANRIDTSKIKLESDIYKDDYALLKGEAIDVPIKVRVVKHERFKVNTGSYYDPVNKVTVPTYSRRVRETVVKTYDISTLNGTAYIDNLPKSEKGDVYYTFEADCADMQGRPIRETAYSTEGFGVIETGRRDYFFVNTNRLEDVFYDTYDYQTIYIYDGEGSYTPDDKVSITTLENGKKLENTNGTVLYSLVQDKHLETGISKTDEFSFSYKPEHMPNMTVAGAYFDGRHVFPIQETYVNYDCAEKQLSFEVTPDKAKYAPAKLLTLQLRQPMQRASPPRQAFR